MLEMRPQDTSCLRGSAQMGKHPVGLRLREQESKVNAFIRAPLIWNQADSPSRPESPGRFSGFPPTQLAVLENRLPSGILELELRIT